MYIINKKCILLFYFLTITGSKLCNGCCCCPNSRTEVSVFYKEIEAYKRKPTPLSESKKSVNLTAWKFTDDEEGNKKCTDEKGKEKIMGTLSEPKGNLISANQLTYTPNVYPPDELRVYYLQLTFSVDNIARTETIKIKHLGYKVAYALPPWEELEELVKQQGLSISREDLEELVRLVKQKGLSSSGEELEELVRLVKQQASTSKPMSMSMSR